VVVLSEVVCPPEDVQRSGLENVRFADVAEWVQSPLFDPESPAQDDVGLLSQLAGGLKVQLGKIGVR
jgi:hypothetical protein